MRIRRLSLIAFGPFTGTSLDLDGRSGGLDVVYGPNEAGKSTTLRSLSGLLFGIPEKTRDAHRHAPGELRIGAVIETGSGQVLEVVRRKGRKGTLLDPAGNVVDEAILAPALAGTTADLFKTMFGLDHDTLRASAQALLDGKGHAGESLFAAGAGAQGVRTLRERLRNESERLFTPRGRDQKTLTKLIAEVRDARTRVTDASTSAHAYLEQERALDAERRTRDELSKRRSQLQAERERVQRLLDVLPHLTRYEDLGVELASLGPSAHLDAGAPERRRRTVSELDEARRHRDDAARDLAASEARLAELGVEPPILALDESVIAKLHEDKGRHIAAERDIPKREGELRAQEADAARALAAVDPKLTLEDVGRLRIAASHAARIRKLSDDRRKLDADALHLRRELLARESRRAALLGKLGPGLPRDPARPHSNLPVPRPETVDRYAGEYAASDARLHELGAKLDRVRSERLASQRELDELERLGAVPTEAELRSARGDRDAAIREALSSVARDTGPEAPVWTAVRAADDVSDRLRREADRVFRFASLASGVSALGAEETALAAEVQGERAARLALDEKWQEEWSKCGISPRTPREMRPLAEYFVQLSEILGEEVLLEKERERLEGQLASWTQAFREAIAPLPLAPDASIEEVAAMLQATSDLLAKMEKVDQTRGRVDGMRRDSRAFAAETARLVEQFLPDRASAPIADAAEELISRHRKATADRTQRAALTREIQTRRATLAKLEDAAAKAEARLQALFSEASVTSLSELEEAERRSERFRSVSSERERTRQELTRLGDGSTVEALVRETRGFDAGAARIRREELDEELERVEHERSEAVRRIATLEAGLPRLEQGALEPALVLSERVAALKRETHRYLRVRLSSMVLEREIERYRQANQGPILERATELFPRLTLGNYSGLRVGFGEHDDAASLLCIRKDGAEVSVDALSDGTRDALYLALRLASLERYVRVNEPMPLVLDDILIQLDDERARAALSVLSEVARLTQVLFFTHHARLVELAKTTVDASELRIHTLPAG